jgi:sarcosine reductase
MRLEIGTFHVREVMFSDSTRLSDGVLYVDRDQVRDLILQDRRFSSVEVHLVRPGESTRLVNLLDVVEPRYKVAGPGNVFPGLLGSAITVGQGRTHRLANLTVMETSEPLVHEPNFWRDAILDMSGPGAEYNLFANTLNLVLEFTPQIDFTQEELDQLKLTNYNRGSPWVQEYHRAVRVAGMKIAGYLAEVTKALTPDQVEVYDLGQTDPALPRVAYSCQVLFHLLYGEFLGWHSTFVHPNEFMDGVLVNTHNTVASTRDATYVLQNHPVIHELYRLHGTALHFFGVLVYRGQIKSLEDKERTTDYAARLLRTAGIDGLVMTWTGSGNPGMDTMLLCQKCEQQGIKTTIINVEMARTPEDTGFVHFVPEADAMVSAGNYEKSIVLPPVDTVIGGAKLMEPDLEASGTLEVPLRYLHGSTNVMGATKLAGIPY